MEATAALELAAMGVGVEFIKSDDDSTMRAHLKHIGTHANAKLPLDIPQPTFLCDPSHRVKVMVKDIFKLALASKKVSECEKIETNSYRSRSSKQKQRHQLSTYSRATNGAIVNGVTLRNWIWLVNN